MPLGQLTRAPLIGLIKVYQWVFSPLTMGSCRFYPSCSNYALDAIDRHGALKGGGLALWRILRCNPWNGGGVDPVPPAAHGLTDSHSASHACCGGRDTRTAHEDA